MNSPYQTPDTDPSDGIEYTKPKTGKWSGQRITIVTLIPMSMCLVCGIIILVLGDGLFEWFAVLTPLTAIVCAFITASEASDGVLSFFSFLALWGLVHAALLLAGFCGCALFIGF